MTKQQYLAIVSAIGLFLLLYFGCETKTPEQRQTEQARAFTTESTDVGVLLRDAHQALSPAQENVAATLEQQLASLPPDDTSRVSVLKQLSGRWYEWGEPALAGYYAQLVAELVADEEAWSIAGSTFAICVQREEDQRVKDFCTQRAIGAFQNAISLDPANVANQVNMALTYTDNPPQDNPMKGILLLRDLQEKYPDNVLVLNTLAGLALRTGQYQRAVERLEQALQIQPDQTNTLCLLAQAYAGLGNQAKADDFASRCRQAQATK